MLDKINETVQERHQLKGETIGETIKLDEVVKATLTAFIDIQREQVEDRLNRFESKRMLDLGKLDLLEELEDML